MIDVYVRTCQEVKCREYRREYRVTDLLSKISIYSELNGPALYINTQDEKHTEWILYQYLDTYSFSTYNSAVNSVLLYQLK